jgi:hypothetical protein
MIEHIREAGEMTAYFARLPLGAFIGASAIHLVYDALFHADDPKGLVVDGIVTAAIGAANVAAWRFRAPDESASGGDPWGPVDGDICR